MGAADTDSVTTVDLSTATRKERQFQVVPVPGHFTRGRWKCWDYKDDKNQQQNDGEKEKNDSMVEVSTIVITASATTTPDLEGISQDTITTMESTPVKEKETSTIVVTSIAPHPTPIHGTPVSLRDPAEMEELMNNPQFTHTVAELATSTGQHVVVAVPNDAHIQQVSVGVVQQSLPSVASAPVTANMVAGDDDNIAAANGAPFPNIDNKIEQAMDLVKTHLTFAVREEIEVLRQNIVELEQKLTHLENENQFLRQYAPPEIVANLAPLAQQRPASQSLPPPAQNSSQSAVTTPTSTASKIPTSGFCEATFVNSLSSVVADVRQQIRNPNPQ